MASQVKLKTVAPLSEKKSWGDSNKVGWAKPLSLS
jgi:hypothetical protein